MRHDIQAWSSQKFYKGKLTPDPSVANRDFYKNNPAFSNDGFVMPKRFESMTSGKSSKSEANYIANKIDQLLMNNTDLRDIGVICPYRA